MASGVNALTGAPMGVLEHIRQSIGDILATPIGTRVMRREYGSALFALVDAPIDRVTVVDIVQATAAALSRWEPRVRVERVEVLTGEPGHLTLSLEVRYLATGEPVRLAGIVV
jgi:hypothetical protein